MSVPLLDIVTGSVAGRIPVDEREARSRQRILVELIRLPKPMDRHADRIHVTGSAIVLGPQGVLLHRHKRLGLWLQPGGHLEPGETPWDAARREAGEETGLRLRWPEEPSYSDEPPPLAHLDVHPGGQGHTHLDLRYLILVAGEDTPAPAAGESQEVRWFDWDEALQMADPGLRGALEALAADQ
jgi:8-oxo-dGTP pyrophosphatase MutT (NUDIX family)